MSIKLGKGTGTLFAFDVVGQNILENDRVISNRAVNGRLRSFRFPTRADIQLDFDFLNETDFDSLTKLIRNGTNDSLVFLPQKRARTQVFHQSF